MSNGSVFLEVPLTEMLKQSWPLGLAAVCAAASIGTMADENEEAAGLAARLEALDLGFIVHGVSSSKVPGLFEVVTEGGVLYVTEDAKYLVAGNLYEVREGGLVNLTEERRATERRELFAAVDESELITFTPDGGARASVMVFTDTDCGYCRQLHSEMANYHANGIEVRYLAYPPRRGRVAPPTTRWSRHGVRTTPREP